MKPVQTPARPAQSSERLGLLAMTSGSVLWGFAPLFFGYFVAFPLDEGVAHRAVWAVIWLACLVIPLGMRRQVISILTNWRQMVGLTIAAALVGINWAIFLYAIAVNQLVEASFGYFIYPLMAIAIGVVVLGERLSLKSWAAVGLATAGVILKGGAIGEWPWIALAVGGSFALYAVLRRQSDVDALHGIMVEMIILGSVGCAFLLAKTMIFAPDRHFFFDGTSYGVMMAIASGLVTALPLLLFHLGNRALAFSQAGFLFYINPSMQLAVGVMIFAEPFSLFDMAAFGLIWTGLILHLLPFGVKTARPE